MSLFPRKVGLVVDRNFGHRIAPLARSFHVWIIESPGNTPFIKQFWDSEQQVAGCDPLTVGITPFAADDKESSEEACARIAGDVDEHHGEFAQDPPWSEIEVFGIKLNTTLREVFQAIGATTFESTQDGFICRRAGSRPSRPPAAHGGDQADRVVGELDARRLAQEQVGSEGATAQLGQRQAGGDHQLGVAVLGQSPCP